MEQYLQQVVSAISASSTSGEKVTRITAFSAIFSPAGQIWFPLNGRKQGKKCVQFGGGALQGENDGALSAANTAGANMAGIGSTKDSYSIKFSE